MNQRQHSLARYFPPGADPSTHVRISRGKTQLGFQHLPCLLARAWPDGSFELLSPAWEVLGYSEDELAGRCVCDLVALEPEAARAAVKSLLTEGGSVAFGLLCKDGRELGYQWNRQFDGFTTSMFIIGDGLAASEPPIRLPASWPTARRAGILAYRAQ
jgi:hypothetical protein